MILTQMIRRDSCDTCVRALFRCRVTRLGASHFTTSPLLCHMLLWTCLSSPKKMRRKKGRVILGRLEPFVTRDDQSSALSARLLCARHRTSSELGAFSEGSFRGSRSTRVSPLWQPVAFHSQTFQTKRRPETLRRRRWCGRLNPNIRLRMRSVSLRRKRGTWSALRPPFLQPSSSNTYEDPQNTRVDSPPSYILGQREHRPSGSQLSNLTLT